MFDAIILFFSLIVLTIFLLAHHKGTYFKRHNVPYLRAPPIVGALKDMITGKKDIFTNFNDIYHKEELKDEPFFGLFLFYKPALFIKDLELIKKVFSLNFNTFQERYLSSDTHDPLGYYNIFMSRNPLWNFLRKNLTNFFTTAKLKASYYLIEEIGVKLVQSVERKLNEDNQVELEVKKITDAFFIDVIASVIFGIEVHSLELGLSGEFQKMATTFEEKSVWRNFEEMVIFLFPGIAKYLNIKFFGTYMTDYIYKVIPQILQQRIESGHKRNDLIDTLIEIKKQNLIMENLSMDDVLCAQAAIFFAGGYTTSSLTTTFALYELSKHPELQNKLKLEIREKEVDTEIDFEVVSKSSALPLLHQTICETLRLYPALVYFDRMCSAEDGFSLQPHSDFKIPKGMPVLIPGFALARDEKYFPDPLKFDPERFSPESLSSMPAYCWIPFGAGPRSCIGERLAFIQVKTALIKILSNFRVDPTESTPKVINFRKKTPLPMPDENIVLKFVKEM